MTTPIDRLMDALRRQGLSPKWNGRTGSCRCPAHEDRNPSLGFGLRDDGGAWVKCHKGCARSAVLGSLGLSKEDLRPARSAAGAASPKRAIARAYASFDLAVAAAANVIKGARGGEWVYRRAGGGEEVMRIVRFDLKGADAGGKPEKEFRPFHQRDGRWFMTDPQGLLPLYRLPDLDGEERVYLVEGEKCADALAALGLPATTSVHGANAPLKSDWSPLHGLEVCILPDHDEAGEGYARTVGGVLIGAERPATVRVVRLPGLPPKGDIVEFIAARRAQGKSDPDIRREIEALAAAAPVMEPGAAGDGPAPSAPAFAPVSAAALIREFPELREPVVEDLLRRAEVLNVVAAPKTGKTWLGHALVLCIAAGLPWLRFRTVRGRVLLIDAELHRETLAKRLSRVASALGVDAGVLESQVDVWAVRGLRLTIDDLRDRLACVPPGRYAVIVLDALYRFLPEDGEENSNETMIHIYNTVDAIAEATGAAVVLVHHTTKGNQAGKSVTDVGAGGGAQSRAADTHLVLRPHEEDGAVVVEAAVRSWRPLEPFCIRWKDPGWALAEDLNPADLRKPAARSRSGKEKEAKPPPKVWTAEEFARAFIKAEPRRIDTIVVDAKKQGVSKAEAKSLIGAAEDAGLAFRWEYGRNRPVQIASVERPLTATSPPPPEGGQTRVCARARPPHTPRGRGSGTGAGQGGRTRTRPGGGKKTDAKGGTP